ncbi:MAG: efflux RND transporter periplasmic adaptor subunit, partial [Patescibacteria group bacterium]
MSKIINFIKARKFSVGGLLLFVVVASYFLFIRTKPSGLKFFTVTRGEVKSEVSVTGKVKPSKNLDLAFEKSGRITRIYVKVGDKVGEGQQLVSLDNSDLIAQLAQAQANLKSQE